MLANDCQAQYRTANFVVYAQQPAFAKQVGDLAEKFRKELAEQWLGSPLPQWPEPCPITVVIERHAGGETSFAFSPGPDGKSQPFDWRMKIYGSPERILDSVLPHEVTHTIFATHYGRPLPRWADEGACTTVEHKEERQKNHQMLMEFLRTDRGIPFNHMFAMKQYPRDILPLYAQGYSLAKYLIMQKGHRHFVDFVGAGMQREIPGREPQTWNEVAKEYYGYDNLSDLQIRWLGWVKNGSQPMVRTDGTPTGVAQIDKGSNDSSRLNAIAVSQSVPTPTNMVNSVNDMANHQHSRDHAHAGAKSADPNESWYVGQSRTGGNATMQRPGKRSPDGGQNGYSPGSVSGIMSPPVQSNACSDRIWR